MADIFKTKELQASISYGFKIDIAMYGKINIFRAVSGAGKSFLCNVLRTAKNDNTVINSINVEPSQIIICDSLSDLEQLDFNVKNRLIIFDRYALYEKDDIRLTDFINKSLNKFIIMLHGKLCGFNADVTRIYNLRYNRNDMLFWSETQ